MKLERTAVGILAAVFALSLVGPAHAQTKTGGADQTAKDVLAALADNKPVALWQALPAGYQKDIKGLITEAAGKLDPEVYAKAFVILNKSVKLLKDKKDFILKGDLGKGAQATPLDQKKLGDAYDAVVNVLDTLFTSELSSLDDLKKADVEKFLSGTGAKLMKQFSTFDQFIDKTKLPAGGSSVTSVPAFFKGVKVTVVKAGPTETTLKIESPEGKSQEQVFTKVEGKWVPKELVDGWAKDMKEAKDGLASMQPLSPAAKKQILGGLKQAEDSIDKLAATKTEKEFTAAVMEIFGPLIQMVKPFLPS